MELPKRKQLRLSGYDYSQNGAYFVTICTQNHKKLLCEFVGCDAHIAPKIVLSPEGRIVEKYIVSTPGIDKYVIMPNHIHMIIIIDSAMWASHPTQSISQIVKSLKTLVTKQIGYSIWQRSFHDHIIRGKHDYEEIWQYIDENPLRWKQDCFY